MEQLNIRLISIKQKNGLVHARLQADAPHVGVTARLNVRFRPTPGSRQSAWAEEAYERALAVLDPA